MGTSLTLEQIHAIKRLTKNVIVCYDGDLPGIEATKRAIKLFASNQINVNVINLPDNLDPDDYINKYGANKLKALLENSSVFAMDYLYDICKKKLILTDINSIENFKNEVFNYLNYYNSNVIIEQYLRKISIDINSSFESLLADYRKIKILQPTPIDVQPVTKPDFHRSQKNILTKKFDTIQKELIKMAILYPDRCVEIDSKFNDLYVTTENTEIMYKIVHYYVNNNTIDTEEIKDDLSPDLSNIFNQILNMKVSNDVSRIEILFDEFSDYPAERECLALLEKEKKEIGDVDKLIKLKQKTIKWNLTKKE